MTRILQGVVAKFQDDAMAHNVPLSPALTGLITDACFPPVPGLAKLILVNSRTDRPVMDLTTVNTVDLTKVGNKLNIEAIALGTPGSVVFKLAGKIVATESAAPYCLGGDSGVGQYADWTPPLGAVTVEATPYREAGGKGDAGPTLSVQITFIRSVVTPPIDPASIAPLGAMVVRKDADLSDAVSQLKEGQVLALERGGVWRESLTPLVSGVSVVSFGTGDRPLIVADNGILFVRTGLSNISVKGIDVRGTAGTAGSGISGFVNRLSAMKFEDVTLQGFRNSISVHCPKMDAALRSDHHLDWLFFNCRFLDSGGPNDRDGQGGFLQNFEGLSFLECLFDRCGMTRLLADGSPAYGTYVHGLYDQHGNRRVTIRRNIFSRCESMGSQSRGYLDDSHLVDPMDDQGPTVDQNVYVDCALGLLVNGPKATVTKNIVQPGHFHTGAAHHGQGAIAAHIGSGLVADNICLGGPAPVGKDWKMPAFTVGPRPQEPPIHYWPWDKPANPTVTNNVEYPDVNLTGPLLGLVSAGRSGVLLGPVRDSMEKLVLDGIKGKTGVPFVKNGQVPVATK